PPDLILLDLILPGLNGFQVLTEIKHSPELRNIPILMMSTVEEMARVVQCIAAGADDYLVKPFETILLRARISACLDKKRLNDQQEIYRQRIEEDNRTLERRIREQVREITRSHLSTIFALARLAESRDRETGLHLQRIREYCRVLCEWLRGRSSVPGVIDDDFIDNIYLTSPLHDIGKVGIPDAILLKPAILTVDEFDIMKTHTTIGAITLREVERQHPGNRLLETGIAVAESHHERWDGRGYPLGLSGAAIPLVGRIVALADVYDALTTRRPYKPAFSHEASRLEIVLSRGHHFDPAVVDAFIAREQDFIAISRNIDVRAADPLLI
ncbi:MAG: response regulator, partial [Vicinamibacteria bacterium]|nr:response regulator [Vicinamibacteria bacterium]